VPKHQGVRPEATVTDKLASYGAAAMVLGFLGSPQAGRPAGQQSGGKFAHADAPTGAQAPKV